MYSVLNLLSEYTYFYVLKNITSSTSYIVESFQCILNNVDFGQLFAKKNYVTRRSCILPKTMAILKLHN